MDTQAKYSIFLVDEDRMFRTSLKISLKQQFGGLLKISEYTTGEKCMERIYQSYSLDTLPDIVILDYYLNDNIHPDTMNGAKVLQELKSLSDDTVVIMLSGEDKLQTVTDSIENATYKYITKGEETFSNMQKVPKNSMKNTKFAKQNDRYLKWNFYMGIFVISMILFDVLRYCIIH